MRFYSANFDDVMSMVTKYFFELSSKISIIEAEERINQLRIVENRLYLKSENHREDYYNIYTQSQNEMSKVVIVKKDAEKEKKKRREQLNNLKKFENVR